MTVASTTGSQWVQTTPSAAPAAHGTGTTAQSTSAAPAQASPPYFSPATHVDPSTGIAVLVVLDDQGKITEQYPSQQVIDEYRRHQGPNDQHKPQQDAQAVTAVKSADGTGSANNSGQTGTDSTA